MAEPRRDRWLSIGLSVLLHGSLIGLLVFGWWRFRERAGPPTLSIDATVVDARTLKGVGFAAQPAPQPKPKPAPAPPVPVPPSPPVSQGPPVPTPQEQALRAQAAQAEAQHQAEARQELQKQQAAKQAEEARAAKAEAQKKAEQRALARKRAEQKKRAEEKKLAEQRKLAEEKKLAAEKAAEKAARAAALAQLQHSIREEEQSDAAARAGLASWTQEIEGRIQDAWIKPSSAKRGIDCILDVTQEQDGTVTNVTIGRCNGDGAVKESIEAAVYRASPLPAPPDPSLFQRQLIIEFKPQ